MADTYNPDGHTNVEVLTFEDSLLTSSQIFAIADAMHSALGFYDNNGGRPSFSGRGHPVQNMIEDGLTPEQANAVYSMFVHDMAVAAIRGDEPEKAVMVGRRADETVQ